MNDFLQKTQKLTTVQEGAGEGGAKPVRRGRRGGLSKAISRRGDIGNGVADDDVSIGMSTIASRKSTVSKIFEFSKGSLTLSMLGGNKGKDGNSLHESKMSKGTKTTDASTHTKSTTFSSFGGSMLSRGSGKNQKMIKEMMDQLEGANKTLMFENQELRTKIKDAQEVYEAAALYQDWFSIQELAQVHTELCQMQAKFVIADRERSDLEKMLEPLSEMMDKKEMDILNLQSENKLQAERIALLEAKLKSENQSESNKIARLEAKLLEKENANKELEARLLNAECSNRHLLESHPRIVDLDNQFVMSTSTFASLGSIGSIDPDHSMDDDGNYYEEDLKSHDYESSSDGNAEMSKESPHDERMDIPLAPPPPPPRHYSTDPCSSHRKKLVKMDDQSRASRSKSPGTRKIAKSLFESDDQEKSSKPENNTMVSTSRLRSKSSTSSGATTRARRSSEGSSTLRAKSAEGRVRRTKSESLPASESKDRGSRSAPTTPTSQTSTRRRLRKGSSTDGLDSSQHSTKSNKSAKSARSASAARRRANNKPEPLSSSTHSTRRRSRGNALTEQDRKTVKEALASYVGTEDDQHNDRHHRRSSSADAELMPIESSSAKKAEQQQRHVPAPSPSSSKKVEQQRRQAPAPSTNKKPISETTIKTSNNNKTSASNKRPTTNDFRDLCSKPMALVQDRARVTEQPRIRPVQSSKCATSA